MTKKEILKIVNEIRLENTKRELLSHNYGEGYMDAIDDVIEAFNLKN